MALKPILLIADPVEKLNPKTDSSLAMVAAAMKMKYSVWISSLEGLAWIGSQIYVTARRVGHCSDRLRPELDEVKTHLVSRFGQVWVRTDPPVNSSYVNMCWLLRNLETKIRFINRPSALLQFHEKTLPLEGFEMGFLNKADLIPTCVAHRSEDVLQFLKTQSTDSFIVKPWRGHAGEGVLKFSRDELEKRHSEFLKPISMIQPFQKAILDHGDRRVIFIRGRYVGDFLRYPSEGSIISNTAQGGQAKKSPLLKSEKKLIEKLEKFLRKIKIEFAGADFIGGRVNEINITSPTGLVLYENLYGINLAEKLIA